MKKSILLGVSLLLMQGCGYTLSQQGAQTAQAGFGAVTSIKANKYAVQAEIARALMTLSNRQKDAAILAMLPWDRIGQLSATGQAAFMENYFQYMTEQSRGEAFAAVARASGRMLEPDAQAFQVVSDATNVSSNNWAKFGTNALKVVGGVYAIDKLSDAWVAGAAGAAAGVKVTGDGNTISTERFDYKPKVKGENNNAYMGDYKGMAGIPLAEGELDPLALAPGEEGDTSECPPTHPFPIPDENRCSDGEGGSVPML